MRRARHYFNLALKRVTDSELNINETLKETLEEASQQYLAMDAERSKNSPDFVNAIVKIIGKDELSLSSSEETAVEMFKKEDTVEVQIENNADAEQPSMEAEVDAIEMKEKSAGSEYENLEWIPATTCEVERFFSQAKLVLTDKRSALKNENLEMVMFLKYHQCKWPLKVVQQAIKSVEE